MFTLSLFALSIAQEVVDNESLNEDVEVTGQHYYPGGRGYYPLHDPIKSNYLDRKMELANQHMSNKMMLMDGILDKFHNLKAGLLDSVLGSPYDYRNDKYHNDNYHNDNYHNDIYRNDNYRNSFLDKRHQEVYDPHPMNIRNYGNRNYIPRGFDTKSGMQSIGNYGKRDIEYFRDNSSYNEHQDKKFKNSYFDDGFKNGRKRRNSNFIDNHPVGGFYSLI